MIPVKQITITRAEGPAHLCGKPRTFDSFDAASRWLRTCSDTFPRTGGYDKHDLVAIFEDGFKYK